MPPLLLRLSLLAALLLGSLPLAAQEPARPAGRPVVLGRDTVLTLYAPRPPFTLEQRTLAVTAMLAHLAGRDDLPLDQFRVVSGLGERSVIMLDTLPRRRGAGGRRRGGRRAARDAGGALGAFAAAVPRARAPSVPDAQPRHRIRRGAARDAGVRGNHLAGAPAGGAPGAVAASLGGGAARGPPRQPDAARRAGPGRLRGGGGDEPGTRQLAAGAGLPLAGDGVQLVRVDPAAGQPHPAPRPRAHRGHGARTGGVPAEPVLHRGDGDAAPPAGARHPHRLPRHRAGQRSASGTSRPSGPIPPTRSSARW